MYALSFVDGVETSTLGRLAWTGLPTLIPNYAVSSQPVHNISQNCYVYFGYLQAKAQSAEVPVLVRSEFGDGYEKAVLRLNGEHQNGVTVEQFVGRFASYADAERYPTVLYAADRGVLVYFDAVRGGWFKKVWRRVKGFCKKVWKALPKVLGVAKKVATVTAPIIPPPYGTAVAGIASATGAVSNALNLIGNVSQKSTGLAMMDTDGDKFIVTPQYRVSSSNEDYIMPNIPGNEYVPNTMYNGEWISADPIEVPVVGSSPVQSSTVFRLEEHPNYENIKEYVKTALAAGNENPLWFQQRLKITFKKTGVVN